MLCGSRTRSQCGSSVDDLRSLNGIEGEKSYDLVESLLDMYVFNYNNPQEQLMKPRMFM
jgi:hypothetical protein